MYIQGTSRSEQSSYRHEPITHTLMMHILINDRLHILQWSYKVILPNDTIVIFVCVSTFHNVPTIIKII
jgi:hypothetical protein